MKLTKRQYETLSLAADGKTEWEIGKILGISEHTADKHLRLVLHKLDASNRVHAVALAFRAGILA